MKIPITEKKDKKKVSDKMIIARNMSEEELNKTMKWAEKGNFPAKIEILMHNQRIINDKLNKLLKK